MKKFILPMLFFCAFSSAQTIDHNPNRDPIGVKIKNSGRPVKVCLCCNKNDGNSPKPLVVLDGKIVSYETIQKLNPDTIASMTVLKNAKATKKYGEPAKFGVIEIASKESVSGSDL